ncbi:helix-turn-helix transcriptional regulator [Halostella litorea]|uniref:helix-turn-helix transcriptional regulator n=1 Tax=Halostella litorea TaxID=2528831 RepID=UPI0010927843|nr:transcriptional regulator FilR1 domain-containing protein [Halostella litorea]
MSGGIDNLQFVVGSRARREVLAALADSPAGRGEVLDGTASSESSVYDAINRLAERGLVHQRGDDAWATTAAGQVIADAIARCERTERTLAADAEYWQRHDAAALPDAFREEFAAIDGYEVVRSPDTDPYRASRRVAEGIASADCVSVITPVYHDRYAEALNESSGADRRLVVTPDVLREVVEEEPPGPDDDGDVAVRVYDTAFAMVVSAESLLLSFPTLDGSYDPHTEVVAETDAAIDWGGRLFEHVWERATDVEAYVADRYGEDALGG